MEDTRKEYVPPTAEVILLAPDEKLAAWDLRFDTYDWNWKTTGLQKSETASGIAVNGTGLWKEDGYTIGPTTK